MILIDIAIVVVALAAVAAAYRMLYGPHLSDRAIAADLLFFTFVALLALYGVRVDSPYVYDVVVVATLIGLISALALARLMTGGRR